MSKALATRVDIDGFVYAGVLSYIYNRFFASRFPLPFGISLASVLSFLGMNKNWWDLIGMIGRSNDLSGISINKDGYLSSNSTEFALPEWVRTHLDTLMENLIKNETFHDGLENLIRLLRA